MFFKKGAPKNFERSESKGDSNQETATMKCSLKRCFFLQANVFKLPYDNILIDFLLKMLGQ